jgi:hypothetical protein
MCLFLPATNLYQSGNHHFYSCPVPANQVLFRKILQQNQIFSINGSWA